jgi:hypothetical protein
MSRRLIIIMALAQLERTAVINMKKHGEIPGLPPPHALTLILVFVVVP